MPRDYIRLFFEEAAQIAQQIDQGTVDRLVTRLVRLRDVGGRLFVCGIGGSAANSSHAVSDLRKIAGIEAYSPVDNMSELTARANDEGWDTVFSAWLRVSRASERDALFVLSVGGGSREHNIS